MELNSVYSQSSSTPIIKKVMPYDMGKMTTQVMMQTTVPTMTMTAKISHGNKKLRRFFTAPQTKSPANIPPRISPSRARTKT